jgi:iturin family lipopeptide synthetase A
MKENEPLSGLEIAVIGMAGRFPAARNIDEYWENIKNGVECIHFFSEEELVNGGISPEIYNRPDYIKSVGGIIEGVEYFDAAFFGYTPTEAELLDPQLRLFHECCWEALEDAGYDPGAYEGLIGLFGGAEDNNEWREKVLLSTIEAGTKHTRILLSSKDFVTARVSYKLNLKGPVYAIITGCSTALTSIHLACRSLIGGECDLALSGGVYVHLPYGPGRIYQEGMLESNDGHLRAFDARASGTVFSSGIGIVVLKIFEDAKTDNDHIYAVIKGSAVNCDGNRKVNFTAPSVKGQVEVIKAAYQAAEVDMESIGYLEAHGTGTLLGDPIEINALKQAFNTSPGWKCPIGSVKTNIGHMDVAAGAAGFIKTVLVLKHKLIPPSLNFETPNPKLELEKTPFYVNTGLTEFKSNGGPRRAAVSSFGFGGTNVHAILEEAPEVSGSVGQLVSDPVGKSSEGTGGLAPLSKEHPSPRYQLILLSAKTPTALDKMTQNLVEYFKNNLLNHENHGNHDNPINPGQDPALILAHAAYTLQVGRQPFPYRKACVCSNPGEAIRALPASPQAEADEDPAVVFMFSGQGSQYVNMGLEIYHSEPVFRQEMDNGFNILKSLTGKDFKAIFYPGPDSPDIDHIQEQMNDAHNSGPIKFIFEYSLGKLLIHWGIRPHAVMGHSFGEYTAACIAGVFSLRDALELALLRGELMLRTPPGGMMSIPLGQKQLSLYLETHPDISLAAVNSSSLCFVSGPPGALARLEKDLAEKDIECMHINFPRAAHSHMMRPITTEFEKKVRTIKLQEPKIPFISGLTGDWLSPGQITDPAYWAKHLEQPVQFCQGIEKLLKEPGCIFVQVGPDKGLPLFINRHNHLKPGTLVINLVKHKKDNLPDMVYLLQQVGSLWLQGVRIDWPAFHANQQRQRISLPTYPFEGKRYWLDINISAVVSDYLSRGQLKKRKDVTQWFYTSSWKRSPLEPASDASPRESSPCLIFTDAGELGTRLAEKLEEKGQAVTMVKPGTKFEIENPQVYRLDPSAGSDYDQLFKTLKTQKKIPRLLIHLWNVTGTKAPGLTAANLETTLELGLYSLLHIVQSLGRLGIQEEMHLEVITDNMQSVIGEEILYPAKAASLGAIWVIPLEYPHISCHSLDIILPGPGTPQEEQLLQHLLAVITSGSIDKTNPVTAIRGNRSWTQTYEPTPMEKLQSVPSRLRQGGVYLITGGLGGIGFVLAEHLVKTVKARLILTVRSQMPARDQWQHWIDTHPEEDRVSQRIKKVMDLEKLGAEVLVFSADSADEKQMQEVVSQAVKHFGQVNGIIHTAGLVDYYGIIQNRTREMTGNILAPKVKGTMILDHLTRDIPLDFFVICSSLASLTPGFGEVGYAAANIFIDAFAHYKNLTGKTLFTAVNWDTWQEVGAAVESVRRQKQAGKTSYIRLEDGIHPTEGWEVFTMILGNPNPQVIVSTKDLDLLLKQYRQAKTEAKAATGEKVESTGPVPKRSLRPRPQLSTPYVIPANSTQQTLTEIWQDYFGIERVGIQDDFFELGGDSLMATIMAARIHKRMNVRIPLTEIFQGPTIELLSACIQGQVKEEFASIHRVEKKEYYPMSPAQKRLFVLQQMEPGLISYNSPDFFILEGELDKDRVIRSLDAMIKRHESLRTSFEIIEGAPMQRVADHIDPEIEYYTGSEEEASLMVKDFVRLFDLRQAPLLRVGLIKLLHTPTALRGHPSQEGRAQKYIYMFDMHHIITDGISLEIFADEFLALYQGRQLPLLTIQYKDFAEWQIRLLEAEEIKKQEQYWLKEFSGEIPLLELPIDYPRPAAQSFEGSKFQAQLSPGDTRGLNRLSQEQDVTLYMTTLAVIKVLFSRLSNQETIIVGTSTAGRQHEDLQHIIGMFVNTLALKSHPAGDKTFSQYLQELKQKSLAALENQDYPFEELVSKLNLDRHLNRNPLFDVMFSFQNFEAPALETPQSPPEAKSTAQVRKKTYLAEDLTSRFDITLFVRENPDSLLFIWEYCTKLFKQETIARFGNYLKKIVSSILDNPGIHLEKIEIITGEEKQRLLNEFNHIEVEYPGETTIHELFKARAQRIPDQVALVGKEEGWTGRRVEEEKEEVPPGQGLYAFGENNPGVVTYKELHEKVDRLAYLLQEKGVQPDDIVGIMADRSIEVVIGILGILAAGGAYLPIDPDYPQDRVAFMLKDSSVGVLLATPKLQGKVKAEVEKNARQPGQPLQIIHIHTDPGFTFETSLSTSTSTCQVGSANLAYIIYTSGTTGKPKGVMIRHTSVVNLLFALQHAYPFIQSDAYLVKTSYIFDVSVTELFGWYMGGGKAVILEIGGEKDPRTILASLQRNNITHINFVPSMFHAFLEILEHREIVKLASLKYIFLAGEALPPAAVNRFRSLDTSINIENIYGPTEATVYASWYSLSGWDGEGAIPIGKPLPNVTLYILDMWDNLQPIGVVGELCIGGTGLAPGYLNRPGLTSGKFCLLRPGGTLFEGTRGLAPWLLKGPHKNHLPRHSPHNLIYRTGDLARWLPDGNIHFLGRMDHQVKIRGFRIELDEIENQLLKHEKVKDCAVIMGQSREISDNFLCAYFTGMWEHTPISSIAGELKTYLSSLIPGYMIPSYFIPLEKIPLTPSGKIDRKALPAPGIARGNNYAAPGNAVEKELESIWLSVLSRREILHQPLSNAIGIDDNFFELGGHSLLLISLISKIRRVFNVELKFSALYQHPTIRGLSGLIMESPSAAVLLIGPSEEKEYYRATFDQKRLFILNQFEGINTTYNITGAFRLEGNLDRRRFEKAIRELSERHDAFRTSFRMVDGELVQVVHKNTNFQIHYINWRSDHYGDEKNMKDVATNYVRPFDLSKAPLIRISLIGMSDNLHILIVDSHHIIMDGVSQRILSHEFSCLYPGEKLPTLKLKYKDYSEWQNNSRSTKLFKQQEQYWLDTYKGDIPVLNLPADFPRPPVQSFEGSAIPFTLEKEIVEQLYRKVKETGATLFMVILAMYNVLLHKYTNQEDIIIGSIIAGRNHEDLENIVGFFAKTLALRNYPTPQKTFDIFLEELKQNTLKAFENHMYPFNELVGKLKLSKDRTRNPLFDTAFVLQNTEMAVTGPPANDLGLTVGPVGYENKTSLFDIYFQAAESVDKISCVFQYNIKLFQKETIELMKEHFIILIQNILNNSKVKIQDLDFATPFEKEMRKIQKVEFDL